VNVVEKELFKMMRTTIDEFDHFTSTAAACKTKPNIVFIHGAAQNGQFWKRQIEGLSNTANCFALNLPGRGNAAPNACESISQSADYVSRYLEVANISRPILCGLSMGGAICLNLLSRNPSAFAGGVIINSGARLKVDGMFFETIRRDFDAYKTMLSQIGISSHTQLTEIRRLFDASMIDDPVTALKDFSACDAFDIMSDLGGIAAPVLILTASDDILTPPKYGDFLHDRIQGSTKVCVAQSGHLSPIEKPEEINTAIRNFISAHQLFPGLSH
jgi:pimeloyl-ACP methyl ester carboxylesterase